MHSKALTWQIDNVVNVVFNYEHCTGTKLEIIYLLSLLLISVLVHVELDHIIDAHDRHGGFTGKTETLNFGDSRLYDSSSKVVSDLALVKVKSIKLLVLLVGHRLGVVVMNTQAGNKLGCIVCGIDSEDTGND